MSAKLVGLRTGFASNTIAALGYGMYFILGLQTISAQYKQRKRGRGQSPGYMLLYSVVMFCLATIWYITGTVFGEVVDVELPFDPVLASALTSCQPMAVMRTLSHTLIMWMGDGLFVWRAWVLWDGNKRVMAVPILAYLTSIGLGVALELTCLGTADGGPITLPKTLHVAIPFYGLSVGLTLLTASLIIIKLYQHRREMQQAGLGDDHGLDTYASISNIIIESAVMYTITGIVFFPLQILNLPAVTPVGVVFTVASFIAPTLIQLRLTQGRAYTGYSQHGSRSTQSRSAHGEHFTTVGLSFTSATESTARRTPADREWEDKYPEYGHTPDV
jgi:hypothetical protein